MTNIGGEGVIDVVTMIDRMSCGPARAFGLSGGTLSEGAAADVTVIDPRLQWTVDPSAFQSRSRNTPFAGRELTGAPHRTIVGGRTVWAR